MNTLNSLLIVITAVIPQTANYDPATTSGTVTIVDTEFRYGDADRIVPLKLYFPESETAAPVLLFSHGLGGSRDGCRYLGNHWAGRGYVVVMMQHAGSDTDVIRNAPRLKRMETLKAAASGKNAIARYNDVKATLDHIELMNHPQQPHGGRFDLTKVGMSGHSFGAVTTQAVSGQAFGSRGQMFTDKRIKAAIAFSPSPPTYGLDSRTFAKVDIPWLLMTGTNDNSIVASRTDATTRRLVFEHLPASNMFYELVFEGGEHFAFTDQIARGKANRNPKHHPAIQSISTAFWDAWLLKDEQAKQWLKGDAARQLLDTADIWQLK